MNTKTLRALLSLGFVAADVSPLTLRGKKVRPGLCRLLRFGRAACERGLRRSVTLTVALMLVLSVFTGCESTDGGGGSVSGSVYYGVGFYDPWYYGGYYDDPDVIVTPPAERPPSGARPEQPIAKPPTVSAPRPTPMPSIPSRPMPRAR